MVWTRSVSSVALAVPRRAIASAAFCTEPESATNWATPAQAGAVDRRTGGLADDVAGQHADVHGAELLGVVGQQALGDQLQQHGVVALERGVDVEVGAQRGEAVLGQEAGAAAGLAAFLQRVEGVPGAQRLERRGEGLEVLAVLRRCRGGRRRRRRTSAAAARARSWRRRSWRAAAKQPALVPLVVEQHLLVGVGGGVELAALGGVLDGDLQGQLATRSTAAPSSETRPWTSVPSIVKKRRPGLAMGDV